MTNLDFDDKKLTVRKEEKKMANNTYKVARSAKDGQFVSMDYAKKHPSTTVVETMKKK